MDIQACLSSDSQRPYLDYAVHSNAPLFTKGLGQLSVVEAAENRLLHYARNDVPGNPAGQKLWPRGSYQCLLQSVSIDLRIELKRNNSKQRCRSK